jgi:hypothetical protein
MFRDNPIGVLILALCGVVGIVLIWQIATGERLSYDGPNWVIWILGIVMLGGVLYGIFGDRIRGESGNQWPSPTAGHKSLWRSIWDRIRGRE